MKICFLATSNSIHSYKWIRFFSNLGYEITWFSIDKKTYEIPDNVNYVEISHKYRFLSILKAILIIRKFLKNNEIDFVHVHYLGFYGLISLFIKEELIATAWGSDVLINKRNIIKKILVKKVIKKSQFITCDAYHLKNVLINDYATPENKIHIINFGIDSQKFSKQAFNEDIRKKLDILDNLTIVSTRGFETIYDIQTLIKAIPLVLEHNPKTKLILVGGGTIKNKLELLVNKLKLNDNVAFIGSVPNKKLPKLLSNMDIYVSTSLSDAGLASSTAEAMACEVPAVVSNSAENDKWIMDGQNGFLFPIKDYKKLASILVKLLQDKNLRKIIGKEGRKIIVEKNDYQNEMYEVNVIYKKIIDG